jgi:hypothetical protein
MRASITGLLLSATLAGPVVAQDQVGQADRLVDALARCRGVAAPDAKLACFETAATALIAARDKREIVVVDREGVRQAKRSVFGFSLPKIRLFGRSGDAEDIEPEVKSIETSVSSVGVVARTLLTLRLADGSTWQTTEQARFSPQAGDPIKIEAGILGSYNAAIRGRGIGKVKRVR